MEEEWLGYDPGPEKKDERSWGNFEPKKSKSAKDRAVASE